MSSDKADQAFEKMKAEQFELAARLPAAWRNKAFELEHAADKLYDIYYDATSRMLDRWENEIRETKEEKREIKSSRELQGEELEEYLNTRLISVYFLLMGYAFENLFKGILLMRHPDYFVLDKKIRAIQSHELVELCMRCNIPLDEEEIALLAKLTEYILWQAKYPIPLEVGKMPPVKVKNGTWTFTGHSYDGRETQEKCHNFYNKVGLEFDKLEQSSSWREHIRRVIAEKRQSD